MTYKVITSLPEGKRTSKVVEGILELHDYLNECREYGHHIKQVRRLRRSIVQLSPERQVSL